MESVVQRRTPCAQSFATVYIPTHPSSIVADVGRLTPADQFIVGRLPIALRMARRRAAYQPEQWPDLFQEACLALVEIVRVLAPTVLPTDIAHLEAQAVIWMHHRIVLAMAWHTTSAYSLPIHALRDWVRVRHAAQQLQQQLDRPATPAEIAAITHLSISHIISLLAASDATRPLESLPEIATADLATPPATFYADQRVRDLVATLPEPERTIITYQFGLGVPKLSLRTLSPRLGLTIRQITRCRQRALAMLHTWLTEDMG